MNTPGGCNQLTVYKEQEDNATYHMASGIQLSAGDEVELTSAYGGSIARRNR